MSTYSLVRKAALRGLLESGLRSAVGMEDEPRFWTAQIDRHLKRVADEVGTHVLGHGEADDAPGGEVDHGREVEPALPGAHVGVMESCT